MGQQQLILLVLATVIVGIAIVVGIRAFTENSAKANADAMVQDGVRIGNDVQAWFRKPAAFGGPAAGTLMSTASFAQIGYQTGNQPGGGTASATQYENINGIFGIAADAPGVIITGTSYQDDNTTARNVVAIAVCGTTDADVRGVIVTIDGVATGSAAPTCS